MRTLLAILAWQLLAAVALAAGQPVLPLAATPELLLREAEGSRSAARSTVASLSREANLGQALELPASEFFVLEEPAEVAAEFELSLPEEELPDSDIPLTLNSKVEYFINYFQHRGKSSFARWLSRSERYIPMMKQVLKREGLPEDLVYLAMIESGFSPHAFSVASAVGPWQFMSGTGKRYALRIDQWIDERRDPLKSTVAAALYLKELYELFNKDWYLAAAGYNAGENKILRAIGMYNSRDFWQLSKGSYLKRETKDYVPKLLAAAIIAKEPARYGFADVAYLPPIEFDTMTVPSQTNLEVLARGCDLPYETIRDFNPELRRWATPPDYPDYQLKIPPGKKASCEAEYAKVPENERFTQKTLYAKYRVKKKESLAAIARRYGTTPEILAELNGIRKTAKVRGRSLIVPVPPAAAETTTVAVKGEEKKEFNKYYTVKKGDTLASLAKRFNVSTRILSAWNNLKGKVALRPGRRIIVAKYEEKNGTMVSLNEENT